MANYSYAIHCPKLPWMIDFHSTADGTIPNSQLHAAFANSYTEHLSFLDVHSQASKYKLTGIICTLSGICDDCDHICDFEILPKMMDAGMTMLTLKMSSFDHETCKEVLKVIREANDNYSKEIGRIYPLAIALDIQGPEIHIGTFKDPSIKEIELTEGKSVSITTDPAYEEHVTEDMIYVDYQDLLDVVEPGDHVVIDNGEVHLEAIEIVGSIIKCIVEKAGKLLSRASVNLPGVPVGLPEISKKDKEDIKFAVENRIDALFISGIRNDETIDMVRQLLGEDGKNMLIITKIDNCCALCMIDDIIKRSDVILIDRCSLAIEIAPEKLFLAQKSIIAKCNQIGKPVICTTQILESTLANKEPTKSEISDIANAVLDGADCFMLSKEITSAEHCLAAIEMLASTCKEAEAAVYQKQVFRDLTENQLTPIEPIYALAISAVEASLKCNAAVIIVLTTTGRSAKIIAKYRPRCPIIAITRFAHVARQLHVFRAIDPIQYIKPLKKDWVKDTDQRVQLGITWGKVCGIVRAGDAIVTVTGSRAGAGFTNTMKVIYATEFDALQPEE